ncbi:uncharacterized protein LOC118790453 [Megalops cyprinoides]|uniref:uncharacterized protein LOC118790453 n=1 Tax=Megalops cyprinoides TaxID=118141 RepID=UPI001865321A|nr:uncharacterized protein LOC118790453 [Megalops cyprinoides]
MPGVLKKKTLLRKRTQIFLEYPPGKWLSAAAQLFQKNCCLVEEEMVIENYIFFFHGPCLFSVSTVASEERLCIRIHCIDFQCHGNSGGNENRTEPGWSTAGEEVHPNLFSPFFNSRQSCLSFVLVMPPCWESGLDRSFFYFLFFFSPPCPLPSHERTHEPSQSQGYFPLRAFFPLMQLCFEITDCVPDSVHCNILGTDRGALRQDKCSLQIQTHVDNGFCFHYKSDNTTLQWSGCSLEARFYSTNVIHAAHRHLLSCGVPESSEMRRPWPAFTPLSPAVPLLDIVGLSVQSTCLTDLATQE